MYISDNLTTNEKGHLAVAGMDSVDLAKKYGTPVYLMDEELIRKNCDMYKSSIEKYYNGKGLVCYASKAFSCKQIYRIAKEQGIGVDVVSMGELYTAMSVDFDPTKMCYHGNNKTKAELAYALECGVSRIVVDSFYELDMLDKLAEEMGKNAGILLRLSPGIDAHTHDFVQTGQIDSKFGFAIEFTNAMEAVEIAIQKKNLTLLGIHCHIGSQIFDLEPFEHTAKVMLQFIADIKTKTGYEIAELNLGGGFGIKYTNGDDPVQYDKYMESVSVVVKNICNELAIKLPFIIIEPGRSIVGSAGVTLYEVGNIKEIPNIRTYVSVDGGMTDNIRYALYGAEYNFIVANKANEEKTQKVTIAGRCCESGDLLAKDVMIQKCEVGDILATLATGAYNYSMSSNYNRTMKPPVVMLYKGKSYIAVKREDLEDVVRNDV
ncbi:MAG: diaminopimelate decarboxylase [Oscillospiraceae bacterium]